MLDSQRLLGFAVASFLVIVIPGPATLYVIANARDRPRRGWFAVAGIIAGDLVLITLSGLGFAALIARWPIVSQAIQIVGGLYLAYIGIGLLRPARPAPAPPAASRALLGGLALTLTNPKPLVFFGAFFGMFVDPAAPSRILGFYTLGAIFELINVAYFATILLIVTRLRRSPGFERFVAGRFHRACGVVLLGVAAVTLVTAVR